MGPIVRLGTYVVVHDVKVHDVPPAASDASTSAPNLAKSADKMEGAIKKSFSGMMSSILTPSAGRAAGSVLATSAFEAVRARATMRDCILLTCGRRSVPIGCGPRSARLADMSPFMLSVAASVCWRSRVTRAFLNRSRGARRREGRMVQA